MLPNAEMALENEMTVLNNHQLANYPQLAFVAHGRDVITTNEAANAINRAPQTLRKWACLENGPIRPVRINGRLAWRVSDLMELLNGGVQ